MKKVNTEDLLAHTVVMLVTNHAPHMKSCALILPGSELDEDDEDQLFALLPGNEEPMPLDDVTVYKVVESFEKTGLMIVDQFAQLQRGEEVDIDPPKCPF
ncbi:VHS1116 protein [Vibrio phage 1]|nr:VHS1116 protein [Vibrio phage 1]